MRMSLYYDNGGNGLLIAYTQSLLSRVCLKWTILVLARDFSFHLNFSCLSKTFVVSTWLKIRANNSDRYVTLHTDLPVWHQILIG